MTSRSVCAAEYLCFFFVTDHFLNPPVDFDLRDGRIARALVSYLLRRNTLFIADDDSFLRNT